MNFKKIFSAIIMCGVLAGCGVSNAETYTSTVVVDEATDGGMVRVEKEGTEETYLIPVEYFGGRDIHGGDEYKVEHTDNFEKIINVDKIETIEE